MTMNSNFYRKLIGAVVLFGTVIVFGAPERSFAEVPSQLDDQTFWQLMNEMSEKGDVFPSENLVSNEPNFQVVLTKLKQRVMPGGVYLGVGPEQNFTYIAALKPSIAFIIDIRRHNLLQHLMYKAIFELADDRATFLSLLFSRPRPEGLNQNSTAEALLNAYKAVPASARLAESTRQRIKDDLVTKHGFALNTDDLAGLDHIHRIFELYGPETGYGSTLEAVDMIKGSANGNFTKIFMATGEQGTNRNFLASEDIFRSIKDMQRHNLIVPIVGDFAGDKALKQIANYLRELKATVNVFYVSNVESYLFRVAPGAPNGGAQKFYENVAALPLDPSSIFIRVSNDDAFKQVYPGYSTHLGSITETLQAFKENRLHGARDVFALPSTEH
jgi:hypothetical protein